MRHRRLLPTLTIATLAAVATLAGIGTARPRPLAVAARPQLEGDARVSHNGALEIRFLAVTGEPTEVRARWGAPPSAADPWWPYAPRLVVVAPQLAGPASCAEAALFTQVRAGAILQPGALSDTIRLEAEPMGGTAPRDAYAAFGLPAGPPLRCDALAEGSGGGLAAPLAVAAKP